MPLGDADAYYLAVKNDTTGQNVLPPTQVFGTSFMLETPLVNGNQYEWGVQAINSALHVTGPWTNSQSFTISTNAMLGVPTLISPQGTVTTALPRFQWTALSGASGYYLAVKDDSTGFDVIGPILVNSTFYMPSISLVSGDKYEWGVQAVDSTGQTGEWTNSQAFSILA